MVSIWDFEHGVELCKMAGHTMPVTDVAIFSDNHRAVSAAADATLKIWNLEKAKELATLRSQNDRALAITPDDRLLISAVGYGYGDVLKVRSLESVIAEESLDDNLGASHAAITPDGQRVAIAYDNKTIGIRDLETRKSLMDLGRYNEDVTAMAITPDSKHLVTGLVNHTVKIWSLKEGAEEKVLLGHRQVVRSVAVTTDGRRIVSGSFDRTIKIWDFRDGSLLATLDELPFKMLNVLAVTSDNRRLAVGAGDVDGLFIWDLTTQGPWTLFDEHNVTSIAVLPNHPHCVAVTTKSSIHLWDLEHGLILRKLSGHAGFPKLAAVSMNGRYICCIDGFTTSQGGLRDTTIRVWDLTGPAGPHIADLARSSSPRPAQLEPLEAIASFSGDRSLRSCAIAPNGVTVVAVGEQIHWLQLEGIAPAMTRPLALRQKGI
jgi:WD40 repeat protein